MKVYRLECDGQGPYRGHALAGTLNFAHENTKVWPAWYDDFDRSDYLTAMQNNWLSGCRSVKSLQFWFGDLLDDLLEIGYNIVCYDAQEYVEGHSGKQLIFNPENSNGNM